MAQWLSLPHDSIQSWISSVASSQLALEYHIEQQQQIALLFFPGDSVSTDPTCTFSFQTGSSHQSFTTETPVSLTLTSTNEPASPNMYLTLLDTVFF